MKIFEKKSAKSFVEWKKSATFATQTQTISINL